MSEFFYEDTQPLDNEKHDDFQLLIQEWSKLNSKQRKALLIFLDSITNHLP